MSLIQNTLSLEIKNTIKCSELSIIGHIIQKESKPLRK